MSEMDILPADPFDRRVERAAKAIYNARPFRTANSISPWRPGEMEPANFDFDDAPTFYQEQCREIARIVLAAADRP
jgi:hypothetical protein